jgi:ATP-dependent Clp protease ATP-binding subunit ClpA
MFQSGIHQRGPFTDANESFKSALGHGDITCIGCTTPAEFRHSIEPDKALERRFAVIRVEPPSAEATLAILQARRPRLEQYYAPLRFPDEVLRLAVSLTDEYLPARHQPDKAIQLVDEAGAFCVTARPPLAEITEDVLFRALEDMIGHSLARTRLLTESDVFETLRAKILGQDEALREIARVFIAGLGEWSKGSGPRGVLLFGGPTGVGKTETALQLARILGAGRENLIRVDCNILPASAQDGGPVLNRLLGSPPGYVGYARGQGGLLSRIRDIPEAIVLFDEFEKGGPVLGRLLLQIIDDGRIEDVDGNLLDFRRAFFVFTTNAGCVYDRKQIGFDGAAGDLPAPETNVASIRDELRQMGLGEEFLARLRHVILFKGLERRHIEEVLARQIESLRAISDVRGFALQWDPDLVPHLAARWQPRFGVRFATKVLRNRISEQLDIADAQGELKGIETIRLKLRRPERGPAAVDLTGLVSRERTGPVLTIWLV